MKSEAKSSEPPPRASRRWVRVLSVIAGLALGLVLTEVLFRARDHGAFPHLNIYVADAKLGVRLERGSSERISFGNNPITSLRINSEGYRGGAWPAPGQDEVLFIGDSQVFGLGLEEEDTISQALTKLRGGGAVINAGVPTYGPHEYQVVLDELIKARKPKTVVYVVNIANDLFEASHPNVDRHAVWDGWAVRKETTPASTIGFPGRRWLMSRSHAVFALRRLIYGMGERVDRRGLPSEGSFHDLVSAAGMADQERQALEKERLRLVRQHESELRSAEYAALRAVYALDLIVFRKGERYAPGFDGPTYKAGRGNPGDIIEPALGENDREIIATVEQVKEGVRLRQRVIGILEKHAQEARDSEEWKPFVTALESTAQRQKTLDALRQAPLREPPPLSPMLPHLRDAQRICNEHGARLVVAVLPLDVQVSAEEWKKYGTTASDMEPTLALSQDVLEAARHVGATAVDLLPPLRNAEPGAFLGSDIHLSPKGARAVAEALLDALRRPERPRPASGLPPGFTHPPAAWEWDTVGEIAVSRSDPAGCTTKMIRHWLYSRCHPRKGKPKPLGISVISGGRGDVIAGYWGESATLVAPARHGDTLVVRYFWDSETRDLTLQWPEDSPVPVAAISKEAPASTPPAASPAATTICECYRTVSKQPTCDRFVGAAEADCARTYGSDCDKLLACASFDPAFPPACGPDQVRAGATGRCMQTCSDTEPCHTGSCIPWQGARVCAVP